MATKKTAAKAPAKAEAKTAAKKPAPAKSTANAASSTPAKAQAPAAAAKTPPTHKQIADLAHKYFVERGHHHGSHDDDWLRAEKELNS